MDDDDDDAYGCFDGKRRRLQHRGVERNLRRPKWSEEHVRTLLNAVHENKDNLNESFWYTLAPSFGYQSDGRTLTHSSTACKTKYGRFKQRAVKALTTTPTPTPVARIKKERTQPPLLKRIPWTAEMDAQVIAIANDVKARQGWFTYVEVADQFSKWLEQDAGRRATLPADWNPTYNHVYRRLNQLLPADVILLNRTSVKRKRDDDEPKPPKQPVGMSRRLLVLWRAFETMDRKHKKVPETNQHVFAFGKYVYELLTGEVALLDRILWLHDVNHLQQRYDLPVSVHGFVVTCLLLPRLSFASLRFQLLDMCNDVCRIVPPADTVIYVVLPVDRNVWSLSAHLETPVIEFCHRCIFDEDQGLTNDYWFASPSLALATYALLRRQRKQPPDDKWGLARLKMPLTSTTMWCMDIADRPAMAIRGGTAAVSIIENIIENHECIQEQRMPPIDSLSAVEWIRRYETMRPLL